MPEQKQIIIYYFSGTGNAQNVANWISEIAKQKGNEVQVTDISKNKVGIKPDTDTMIGFVSPTHGFNYPPVVFKYILRFPKGNGQKVFLANTRAGMKLGKLFVPGLSGMALYFAAIALRLKGYRIIALKPIDLPSNWISIHPGLKDKVVDSIYKKRKTQTEKFARKILSGKKDFKALREIIQDLIITPIAILYYIIGRFFFAKSFIASNKCNNCGLCIKECPVKAIKFVNDRPYWTHKCESCMHCMNACPQRAIETAHGFVTAVIIIVNMLILAQLYKYSVINIYFEQPGLFAGKLSSIIFEGFITIGILFFSYRINHFLLRFSFYEKLVVYSSFTKYKFWRRYKTGQLQETTKVSQKKA